MQPVDQPQREALALFVEFRRELSVALVQIDQGHPVLPAILLISKGEGQVAVESEEIVARIVTVLTAGNVPIVLLHLLPQEIRGQRQPLFQHFPHVVEHVVVPAANPPEDENDLNIRLINLHTAQMEQARQVRESFFYNNADPAQGKHFIIPPPGFGITERRIREASEVPRGKTGLRQVLATQRRLWLMKGLFRVLTDPKVGITAVNRIAAGLANPEDVGFPGEPRSEPYVLLNWDIQVELPLEKIPALLNRLAVSERHLRVDDVAILAQPEAVLDYRGGSPTWHRAESPGVGAGLEAGTIEVRRGVERRRRSAAERPEARVDEEALRRELSVILRRQGRLVIVVLKGVSFDFLQLPQGYKGWPT